MDLEIRMNKISRKHEIRKFISKHFLGLDILKQNNRIYSNNLSFRSLRKGEVMKIKPFNIPIY